MALTQQEIDGYIKQLKSPNELTQRAGLINIDKLHDLSPFRALLIDLTDPMRPGSSEGVRELAFNCIGTDISNTGDDSPYSAILSTTITAGIEQKTSVKIAALNAIQCAIHETQLDDDYKVMLIDTAKTNKQPDRVREEAVETFAFCYRTTNDPDDLQDYGDALHDIVKDSKTPRSLICFVLDSAQNFIDEHSATPEWLESILIDVAENPNFKITDRGTALDLYVPAIQHAEDATCLFESLTQTLDVARETNDEMRMQGVSTAYDVLRNKNPHHAREDYDTLASALRNTANTDPNRNVKYAAKECLDTLGLPSNAIEVKDLRITFHTQANFPTDTMHKSDAYAFLESKLKGLIKPDEDKIAVEGELDGKPVTVRIPKSSADTILFAAFNSREVILPKALRYDDGSLEGKPAPYQP